MTSSVTTDTHPYTPDEMIVAAMSRQIKDGDVIGLGLATPMATVAAFLARETHAPGAVIILSGAVHPKTHDIARSMLNPAVLGSLSAGFLSHTHTMDMAERGVYTIQFLRPGQVDRAGNMNTSLIGSARAPKMRLPGGLATGDVTLLLSRIILYQPNHELRNFPGKVDYQTGVGHPSHGHWRERMKIHAGGPTKIITNLCILAFDQGQGGFAVESIHPGVSRQDVSTRLGFDVTWPEQVPESPTPGANELDLLRKHIDPHGIRRLERKEHRQEVLHRLSELRGQL